MKTLKTALSLVFMLTVTSTVFAQKSKVTEAQNYLYLETPDFEAARQAISMAFNDPTTSNLAATWYVAGLIGYEENKAMNQLLQNQQHVDLNLKGKRILESYHYFLKAYELYSANTLSGSAVNNVNKIKEYITNYYNEKQDLYLYGLSLIESKDSKAAVIVFETIIAIPKLTLFGNNFSINSEVALFSHQYLTVAYEEAKDNTNLLRLLKSGYITFPDEKWFLQKLINYYIFSGQNNEALIYLNIAIEKDPINSEYIFTKGRLEEDLGNEDSALNSYKKAIAVDPNHTDAFESIGRIYYNKAVELADKTKNNRSDADALKIENLFTQSLYYYQKLSELKPSEISYLQVLKKLYYRLKMDDEYSKTDARIKALSN